MRHIYAQGLRQPFKAIDKSIIQDSIDEVGQFSEIEREMNLNADSKRHWFDKIESIDTKKMNVSIPLNLDFIPKKNL